MDISKELERKLSALTSEHKRLADQVRQQILGNDPSTNFKQYLTLGTPITPATLTLFGPTTNGSITFDSQGRITAYLAPT